jgi:hypothetical protein
MKKKYFFLIFFLSIYSIGSAQFQLSEDSEISIVTAGPGKELYEAFGHSAIRIKDPVINLDIIYNYGIFDFDQPNFYTNFAKGNMIYSLARYDFKYFLANYKRDQRWLKQQVLFLTLQEKQAYFSYLEKNVLQENKNYLYDPYFNNCATILRDITKSILGAKVEFNTHFSVSELTLRQLTNNQIHWNSWGRLGLNLIAGTKLDRKASFEEYMYLPDYLYSSFKNATIFINNQPKKIVEREDFILNFSEKKIKTPLFNPFLIMSIFSFLGLWITYNDFKNNKRTRTLDFTLFFMSGLIGCVLFFLWVLSSHSTAPNNLNVLWSFAPNIFISFVMLQKKHYKWLQKYLLVLLVFLAIIPFLWLAKVQVFPMTIIPILVLLFVRYLFLYHVLFASKK